jgi:hypothetical protein
MPTRFFRQVVAVLSVLIQAACASQPGTVSTEQEGTLARAAATAFIGLLDRQEPGAAWDTGCAFLRTSTSRASWAETMTALQASGGGVRARTLEREFMVENPPPMPSGRYVLVEFKTTFVRRSGDFREQALVRWEEPSWKVCGYSVSEQ